MNNLSDHELIIDLQHGSLDALGILYDRYRQLVFRTAIAITGDYEVASDLLQDVFLRLFRFADKIDVSRPLQPWLYRMTTNLAYTWVKRDRRWKRPFENLSEWLSGSTKDQTNEAVEQLDDWDRLQHAVASLPLPQRVVVVLFYLNDLSIQEIGEILNIPVGTVKSRLHYGRIALKNQVGLGAFAEKENMPGLRFEGP